MANTSIRIRMDADLKRQIPFEVSGDVPNAETVEAIQEVKRMKANSDVGKTYSNVDQMMEEGRYTESLRYIERGHNEALDEGILTYMPVILCAEARIRYREGQRDEALGILRHIAPYMDLTGQHEHAAAVRNWVQENMGVRL